MTPEESRELIDRYLKGECTEEEIRLIKAYQIEVLNTGEAPSTDLEAFAEAKVWSKLSKRPRRSNYVVAAAAVFLFVLAGAALLRLQYPVPAQQPQVAVIGPGGNKAILTLADGREITLNDKPTGTLATEDGVAVVKKSNGQVRYEAANTEQVSQPAQNKITTPNGGQYELILPDGSRAWLNAGSSISYPVVFNGHERKVQMSGEVYFEIAKNPTKPFIVLTNKTYIKVTGTHFDVFSFSNLPVKTTLSEGRVEVSSLSKSPKILRPGQQAISSGDSITVKDVDADDIISWKDGYFVFKQTPLKEALQQLCRWYDVSADLENMPAVEISGNISNKTNLATALDVIGQVAHVKLFTEERRIKFKK